MTHRLPSELFPHRKKDIVRTHVHTTNKSELAYLHSDGVRPKAWLRRGLGCNVAPYEEQLSNFWANEILSMIMLIIPTNESNPYPALSCQTRIFESGST